MTKQQLKLIDNLIQAKIEVLESKLANYDGHWAARVNEG